MAQEIFSFQLDLLGPSPYASLNLERKIINAKNKEIKLKFGIGVAARDVTEPTRTYIKWTPAFPVALNLLFGTEKKKNNFEIGVQATYITEMTFSDAWDPAINYTGVLKNKILSSYFIGYRFRPFKKRGIIRIGYTPIVFDQKIINWGVLSLGWSFKKRNKE